MSVTFSLTGVELKEENDCMQRLSAVFIIKPGYIS